MLIFSFYSALPNFCCVDTKIVIQVTCNQQVLPKKADWIKQHVVGFDPANNKVMTDDGQEINYQYLVVALGLQLNYSKVSNRIFRQMITNIHPVPASQKEPRTSCCL